MCGPIKGMIRAPLSTELLFIPNAGTSQASQHSEGNIMALIQDL
jgi:hypothetical protein